MKFDGILIASDIDGTFLGKGERAVERNYEKLRYFVENGGHFTFSTGRVVANLNDAVWRAGALTDCPSVTGNGMCLYDLRTKRVIRDYCLDTEQVIAAVKRFRVEYPDMGFRLAGREGIVVCQTDNAFLNAEKTAAYDGRRVLPIEECLDLHLYKFVLRAPAAELAQARKTLEEMSPHTFTMNCSDGTLLDIQAYGRSKATLLSELRDELSEKYGKPITLYAVGDYENDIEMLRLADVAVCPANAIDAVKEVCDLCLCDHDLGVLADLVEHLDRK